MVLEAKSHVKNCKNHFEAQHLRIFKYATTICVTVPNFIKIGQTVAKIWRFNGFQNGGRSPSWILEIQIF